MNLRRLSATILATLIIALNMSALDLNNERLSYKVLYKWGLIHKQAGTANFHITQRGNKLHAVVTAKSAPWADKVYHLRDTLSATMTADDFTPSLYERIAHEDGKYSHDLVTIRKQGNTFSATAERWRRGKKKGAETNYATLSLSAQGKTVDLLTSFYYLRSLNFEQMTPGQVTKCNIFSARRKETLTITYQGITDLKLNNTTHKVYKVKFTFTSDGRQSSDPIEVWLTTGPSRIPLKLVGKLKIGQIQCLYTGKISD